MKIFDCFIFFNELEILDLRLMTLSDVVDYFVIVEANKTFTDNDKPFFFGKNSSNFKKYLDKIIYIKVEDTPLLDKSKDIWAIENFQRDCIARGLGSAKDGDRIIISDIDEIPDPVKLIEVKDCDYPITFNQYLFYYFVNCFGNRGWNGSTMVPFKYLDSPVNLRAKRRKVTKVRGGWHYSYMGGAERIKSKLDNLSDAFTRRDLVGTDEEILRKINFQKDLWDENRSHTLIDINDRSLAPSTIKKFIKKYPDFYFKQI